MLMKKIKVIRKYFSSTTTIGELLVDDKFFCYTLEDVVRPEGEKVQNETAIPYGCYDVVINHSVHFNKDLPQILNVPNFEGVRIHGGNKATDTEGCILVGANTNFTDQISLCAGVLSNLMDIIRENDSEICELEIIKYENSI